MTYRPYFIFSETGCADPGLAPERGAYRAPDPAFPGKTPLTFGMDEKEPLMEFTGERFIMETGTEAMHGAHLKRYQFASGFVAGKRVLDIASGSGYGSRMLADAGAASVTGVDISAEAVAFATERYGSAANLKYVNADACAFTTGTYDVITSFETIEHLHQRDAFLANLHGMLAPGGTLLMSTPNKSIKSAGRPSNAPKNKYHVYEYRQEEFLAAVTQAGFKIEKVMGQHLYPFFFRLEKLGLRLRRYKFFENTPTDLKSLKNPLVISRFIVIVAKK
jgi:2-polyprenyl-3-methyl-5-hydroxy-6-metoxy-1,4-benzoquinol methylase